MTAARWRVLALLAALACVAATFLIAPVARDRAALAPRPVASRPTLLLLTSLPLLFSEDFSLKESGSPALDALQRRYHVVPISVTSGPELAKGRLLLMAHPLAQTAENLVALDQWVRVGGRVMLLADPLLEWPSARPLGDPLRPPPMFMDTGLLAHWGLRLDAPDVRGPAVRKLAGFAVTTVSPGSLVGTCPISTDRFTARCRLGRGEAVVIADADILDLAALGRGAEHNLAALSEELARLESS